MPYGDNPIKSINCYLNGPPCCIHFVRQSKTSGFNVLALSLVRYKCSKRYKYRVTHSESIEMGKMYSRKYSMFKYGSICVSVSVNVRMSVGMNVIDYECDYECEY